MKKQFAAIAIVLLALIGCNKKNAIEPQGTLDNKVPISITYSGKIEVDGVIYESTEKATMLLPEKYWPENRISTAIEAGVTNEKNESQILSSDYYFTMYDGGSGHMVLYSGSLVTFTAHDYDLSLPSITFTDFRVQPRTNIHYNSLNGDFYQGPRLSDLRGDAGCNSNYFTILPPYAYFSGFGWKIGNWSDWDNDGWAPNACQYDVDTWQITIGATGSSSGVLEIQKVVFHLQAI